jgi:hypoxanthine-DNA glycosylase
VVREDARILILGSMPGVASLTAQQYYAHPHNQFWPILARLFDLPRELPYEERLARLQAHQLALWDVLESCVRPGSLDAAIEHDTAVANDIPGLLRRYPGIVRICCNGTTAYTAFRRHFGADPSVQARELRRLPSTSPANAGWSATRKLAAWREGLTLDGMRTGN